MSLKFTVEGIKCYYTLIWPLSLPTVLKSICETSISASIRLQLHFFFHAPRVKSGKSTVAERFRTLRAAAQSYHSFSGNPEQMNGSVRFIYVTDGIQ